MTAAAPVGEEHPGARATDGLAADPAAADPTRAAPAAGGTRRRLLTIGIPGAVVVAALVVTVVQATANAGALPLTVDAPPLSGTSLVAYGTLRAPAATAKATRYDPYGYTVFQPNGGSLHVALRCVGTGRVVITAGQRFTFRCPGPDRVLHLDDDTPHVTPFVVMGITTGDVVWSVRIVERPLPAADTDSAYWSVRFSDPG